MAKTSGIRKTIEILLKKVEALENQSFAQKLVIDELENKLQLAETLIKQVQENPFGIPLSAPSLWTSPPAPMPLIRSSHVCTVGTVDQTGAAYCTTCGAHMSGPSWTITSTSDKTSSYIGVPASQSSTGVEDTQEFEIVIDPDFAKIK